MRIAINCRSFLNRQYAGIGRYAYNLVKTLSEIDHDNEYWLYVQKRYFDFKRRAPRVASHPFACATRFVNDASFAIAVCIGIDISDPSSCPSV